MLDLLRHPPAEFKDVIQSHFRWAERESETGGRQREKGRQSLCEAGSVCSACVATHPHTLASDASDAVKYVIPPVCTVVEAWCSFLLLLALQPEEGSHPEAVGRLDLRLLSRQRLTAQVTQDPAGSCAQRPLSSLGTEWSPAGRPMMVWLRSPVLCRVTQQGQEG